MPALNPLFIALLIAGALLVIGVIIALGVYMGLLDMLLSSIDRMFHLT